MASTGNSVPKGTDKPTIRVLDMTFKTPKLTKSARKIQAMLRAEFTLG